MTFLSVVANPVPGAVTTVAMWPIAAEVDAPFTIDPGTGAVAVVTDPVRRAIEHILSVAFTAPGERVMRPTYGVGLNQLVFANSDAGLYAAAAAQLQTAVPNSGVGYTVMTCSAVDTSPNTLAFQIEFIVDSSEVIHQAVFDWQGDLVGYS